MFMKSQSLPSFVGKTTFSTVSTGFRWRGFVTSAQISSLNFCCSSDIFKQIEFLKLKVKIEKLQIFVKIPPPLNGHKMHFGLTHSFSTPVRPFFAEKWLNAINVNTAFIEKISRGDIFTIQDFGGSTEHAGNDCFGQNK